MSHSLWLICSGCSNTKGSYSCSRDSVYCGDSFTCDDIDECAPGVDNCDTNATCFNSGGDFSCACYCGFAGSGTSCSDVYECMSGNHNCDANESCSNTFGSIRLILACSVLKHERPWLQSPNPLFLTRINMWNHKNMVLHCHSLEFSFYWPYSVIFTIP